MKTENLYPLFLFLILLFFLMIFVSIEIFAQSNNSQSYKDDKYHFTIQKPYDWQTIKTPDNNTSLRLAFQSPDSRQIMNIYAFKIEKKIDLEKFAKSDTLLFSNLGKCVDVVYNWKFKFFYLTSIEKTYQINNVKTKLLFKSQSNFGYVIMWKGYDNDFSQFTKICESFKTQVPLIKKLLNWSSGWFVGLIGLIVFLGVAFLLGLTGVYIRKKIKTTFKIIMTVLVISIIYLCVYIFVSRVVFFYFLFALVPMILGYFGIFFTLSDDPTDYL